MKLTKTHRLILYSLGMFYRQLNQPLEESPVQIRTSKVAFIELLLISKIITTQRRALYKNLESLEKKKLIQYDNKMIKKISRWLSKFEFVEWDRFIETNEFYHIYGWINRDDNYKDFIVIDFSKKTGLPDFWISSSHTFDHKIIEVLKHLETLKHAINNAQCKRVEDFFPIKNKVVLK